MGPIWERELAKCRHATAPQAATWTATTITTSSPLATARDKGHHLNTALHHQLTVHSQYYSVEQRIDWLYLYLINSTHFYSHASVQFPLLRFVCDLFSMPKPGLDLFSIKFHPPTLFHSLALVKSLAVEKRLGVWRFTINDTCCFLSNLSITVNSGSYQTYRGGTLNKVITYEGSSRDCRGMLLQSDQTVDLISG